MKLYWLIEEERYVHRQSDIPKGARHETREIATDLAGLMLHLNQSAAAYREQRERFKATIESINRDGPDTHILEERERGAQPTREAPPAPLIPAPEGNLGSPPTEGTAVMKPNNGPEFLSSELPLTESEPCTLGELRWDRMSAPSVLARTDGGSDIDAVCERICKSRGHVLARFAKCVAVAYEGLKA